MDIKVDNLTSKQIAEFLQQHVDDMKATSPPESQHALDIEGLRSAQITFWTVYDDDLLIGCGALKEISPLYGEVKSMRVRSSKRGTGIGSVLMDHIIQIAKARNYTTLKLETGSMAFFEPARRLYLKHGFVYCDPFENYKKDPNSVFMELNLNA